MLIRRDSKVVKVERETMGPAVMPTGFASEWTPEASCQMERSIHELLCRQRLKTR